MRRLVGVLAVGALIGAAGVLAVSGPTGAGTPAFAGPTLRVHKTVSGTSATPFTVEVQCLTGGAPDGLPPSVTLPFLADGTPDTAGTIPAGWTSNAGDWKLTDGALLGDTCTVIETNPGAALAVSYSCAYADGTAMDAGALNGATPGCPGAASGPSATPAAVTFPDACEAAIDCFSITGRVTVTNTMPTITVGPTASVPGGTVTISGTGCVQQVTPAVAAAAITPGVVTGIVAFTPPVAFGPVTAQADGTWSTTIVVPAGTLPGSYAVSATCTLPALPFGSAQQVTAQATSTFTYPTRFVTVAVAASPKFTG